MLVLENARLLIIDDHADTRILLTFVLELEGAEAIAMGSAIAALAALKCLQADVIISLHADMDGYALMREVMACEVTQCKLVPAIALTGSGDADGHQLALSVGFDQCLYKPVEPDQLVADVVDLILSNRDTRHISA